MKTFVIRGTIHMNHKLPPFVGEQKAALESFAFDEVWRHFDILNVSRAGDTAIRSPEIWSTTAVTFAVPAFDLDHARKVIEVTLDVIRNQMTTGAFTWEEEHCGE